MGAVSIAALRGWDLLEPILAGENPGAPAVAFWKHHPVADQDAGAFAEATLAFQRRVDCDFVKMMPASSYQLVDSGLRDEWIPDGIGRRTVTHRPISEPDDWLRLARRRPHDGFTGEILGAAAMVRRRLAREIPLIATIFNPAFQAVTLAGSARFFEHREAAPDQVAEGLAVISANTVELIEAFRDAGVDGFYLASQHATAGHRELTATGDAACVAAMRGALSMMHLHGGGIALDACPVGVHVLHYDCTAAGNPSVRAAMRRFGGVVSSGLPDEGLPEQRFILSSGCVVPLGVCDESLAELVCKYRPV
jgi:uroporphyrinogen decarboxylase